MYRLFYMYRLYYTEKKNIKSPLKYPSLTLMFNVITFNNVLVSYFVLAFKTRAVQLGQKKYCFLRPILSDVYSKSSFARFSCHLNRIVLSQVRDR